MDITPDQRKDVESFLRAIITEAYRQADLVGAFLVSIGFLPPPHRRRPGYTRTLPQDMLLKLGALLRIYQWEQADMLPHLRADLVLVQSVATEQLVDRIAKLLWRHRHLALPDGENDDATRSK